MELKQSLINTRNAIRKKYQDLNREKLEIGERSSVKYKPIIDPIKSLIDIKKEEAVNVKSEPFATPAGIKRYDSNTVFKTAFSGRKKLFDTEAMPSTSASASQDKSFQSPNVSGIHGMETSGARSNIEPEYDPRGDEITHQIYNKVKQNSAARENSVYGIRSHHGELYMGKEPVTVKEVNSQIKYCIRRKQFAATPGLTDLLLLNNPKQYSDKDLQSYKEMLQLTAAHKTNYKYSGSIRRSNKSIKYKQIVSKLFPEKQRRINIRKKLRFDDDDDDDDGMEGEGINWLPQEQQQQRYKTFNKSGTFNYIYWDDPNELVDRLRLLVASQAAGHTGHNNEIISIIEELREAKIIV